MARSRASSACRGLHAADLVEITERAFSAGNVHIYPDATHALNGEQPDRIAADVAGLLARVGS